MSDLTHFLLERIDEDERHARKLAEADRRPVLSLATTANHPQRILLECEAKRRIVVSFAAGAAEVRRGTSEWAVVQMVLRLLALPYADHADYDASWRP
jgi:hypothetical protein